MYKILICGDRNWKDAETILAMLREQILLHPTEEIIVIHGNARGADKLGAQAALNLGIQQIAFPADWYVFRAGAGPLRNQQMIKEKPDIVLAFHDDLTISKGTTDMLVRARKNGIPYNLYRHDGSPLRWRPEPELLA